MISFDRFTQSAQEVAQRAAEIMQRYSHNQIDTEHLLLALIEQPQGGISQLLEFLKVDAKALSEELDDILRTGPKGDHDTLAARLLKGSGLTRDRVYDAIQQMRG